MQTPENLTMIAGFDITKLESIQLILIVTADEDQRRDKKSPYALSGIRCKTLTVL
jgi:hypothetical protein